MLVAADVLSALLVCGAVAALTDDHGATLVSLAYVPAWVVLAKLQGLYDRDHRTLRPLTVDEAPRLLTWALTGTLGLGLLMVMTSTDTFDRVFAGVFAVAIVSGMFLRALARFVWRRIIPPERVMIVGDGALASSSCFPTRTYASSTWSRRRSRGPAERTRWIYSAASTGSSSRHSTSTRMW
jgi:hypothetical protein